METHSTRPSADHFGPVTVESLGRLFVWANRGCNARCRICDIWRERPGSLLTASQISALLPEWLELGVSRVVLCGEPLLHPELESICSALRGRGIKLDLLTNGLLLKARADEVARCCDVLQVSLDGPPDLHNHIRGLDVAFERLRLGTARVHQIVPELPIDGRCAVHRLNFRRLRDTVATARALGLRSISFSATDLYNAEAFKRYQTLTPAHVNALLLRGGDLEALRAELAALVDECAADFVSGFISDTPEDLHRTLLDYYAGIAGVERASTPACNAPWRSAVLEHDGTLRPCFPLPAYGNVFEEGGLRKTINNATGLALRETLDVTKDPRCLGCVCQTYITDRAVGHWRSHPAAASWTAKVRS